MADKKLFALLEKAYRKDPDAVNELITNYYSYMHETALIITGNEEQAEKAIKNTSIRMINEIAKLDNANQFEEWLKKIISEESLKLAGREHHIASDILYDASDEQGTNIGEVTGSNKNKQKIIRNVFNELSPEERLIFSMHFKDGETVNDIADELGISYKEVGSILQSSKNQVNQKVKELQDKKQLNIGTFSPLGFAAALLRGWKPSIDSSMIAANAETITETITGTSYQPATAGFTEKAAIASKTAAENATVTTATTAASAGTVAASTGILAGVAGKIVIGAAISVAAVGGGTVIVKNNEQRVQQNQSETAVSSFEATRSSGVDGFVNKSGSDSETSVFAEALSSAVSSSTNKETVTSITGNEQIVWIAEPGNLDIDGYYNLLTNPCPYSYNIIPEGIGYSIDWMQREDSAETLKKPDNPDAIVVNKDGKYGFYDYKGNAITPIQYNRITYESYGNTITAKVNEAYYYVFHDNYQGELVENLGRGSEDYPLVIMNGELSNYNGPINSQDSGSYNLGNGIYPVVESFSYSEKVPEYAIAKEDGTIIYFPEGYTPLYTKYWGQSVMVDENNNFVYTEEYERALMSHEAGYVNGVVKLIDNFENVYLWNANTQSFISNDGFQDATYYEEGICGIKKNGKWAFIDRNGKQLTDYIFDKVSAVYEGKAYVTYNGQVGIIDLSSTLAENGIDYSAS